MSDRNSRRRTREEAGTLPPTLSPTTTLPSLPSPSQG